MYLKVVTKYESEDGRIYDTEVEARRRDVTVAMEKVEFAARYFKNKLDQYTTPHLTHERFCEYNGAFAKALNDMFAVKGKYEKAMIADAQSRSRCGSVQVLAWGLHCFVRDRLPICARDQQGHVLFAGHVGDRNSLADFDLDDQAKNRATEI